VRIGNIFDLTAFLFSMHVFLVEKQALDFRRILVSGDRDRYVLPVAPETSLLDEYDMMSTAPIEEEVIEMVTYGHVARRELYYTNSMGKEVWACTVWRMNIGFAHYSKAILYTEATGENMMLTFSPESELCHREVNEWFNDGEWAWEKQ
jgi:hypothetical protein